MCVCAYLMQPSHVNDIKLELICATVVVIVVGVVVFVQKVRVRAKHPLNICLLLGLLLVHLAFFFRIYIYSKSCRDVV